TNVWRGRTSPAGGLLRLRGDQRRHQSAGHEIPREGPMQRVLSNDLWTEVRKQARASDTRLGAIAYVTRDLVGFRKGDSLVVDASARAIRNDETGAPLLRKLHKKGVQLYDCADLHAKTLLLDDVAIISSGNMSLNSETRMVEAALISDQGSVVAGV